MQFRQEAPVAAMIDAVGGIVFLKCMNNEYEMAHVYAADLLARSEAENNARGTFWACQLHGMIAAESGRLDDAVAYFDRLTSIAPSLPNPDHCLATGLLMCSGPLLHSGRWDRAGQMLQKALELARLSGDPFLLGNCLDEMCFVHRYKGAFAEACEWLLQSMTLYNPKWNTCLVTNELVHAAQIARAAGQARMVARFLAALDVLPKPFAPWEDIDPILHYAKSQLGPAMFDAAWKTGQSLQWPEILAEVESLLSILQHKNPASANRKEDPFGLSRRERDVLRHLVEGRSNRVIAEELCLSERTVENHVLHVLTKLNLDSRTAAATFAIRHGLD
jgi:DNA-binding CsgD family transcriptional regulator